MLALAIILPLVLLVVIPGLLLVFGLCRAAAVVSPVPGESTPVRRSSRVDEVIARRRAWRNRDVMRRRVARADYN
jgi:hypothetical protein